jgi:hypothetical protein
LGTQLEEIQGQFRNKVKDLALCGKVPTTTHGQAENLHFAQFPVYAL